VRDPGRSLSEVARRHCDRIIIATEEPFSMTYERPDLTDDVFGASEKAFRRGYTRARSAPVWIVPRPAACVKLVERLRYHVATMQSAGNDGIVRLLNEAAEELEKMQHESNDMLLRVARLRAALENIVKEYEDNSAAFSIARCALREEDQVKKGGSRRPR
jgi:hypothetical protein